MLKMHIIRIRIAFEFMLWLAEVGIDDDVIFGLISDVFTKVNVPNLFRGLSLSSEPFVLFVIR